MEFGDPAHRFIHSLIFPGTPLPTATVVRAVKMFVPQKERLRRRKARKQARLSRQRNRS